MRVSLRPVSGDRPVSPVPLSCHVGRLGGRWTVKRPPVATRGLPWPPAATRGLPWPPVASGDYRRPPQLSAAAASLSPTPPV